MTETLIIEILIGITCGSLGFGLSQLMIVGEVKAGTRDLELLRRDFELEQRRTDERILAVADLVGKAIEACRDLIAVMKVNSKLEK